MIVFDCPECGEEMEVSDRKAGHHVHCVNCGAFIEVRERAPSTKKRKRKRKEKRRPDYLEGWEYAMYGTIFALSPCINAIISMVLHAFWNEQYPMRAYQINQLSWIIFAVQFILGASCCCISAIMRP